MKVVATLFGVSLFFTASGVVLGAEVRITSVDDFIKFSNNVSIEEINYAGTTVFLDSDLSFSGHNEAVYPIGHENYFCGTFDGQGHIIRDLKINKSTLFNVGLFGYSPGLTIRNVVLDSSCSLTCSYSSDSSNVYTGGIIGECNAINGQCSVENSVNMANVTFNGNIEGNYLYLGGIAGWLYSSEYNCIVKNCANYGTVTYSGISDTSYIGGIVGSLPNTGTQYTYIYNCFNYGAITYGMETTNALYIGGITGYSTYADIENCVNAGKIILSTGTPSTTRMGSIAGCASNTYSSYCYFTNDTDEYGAYGNGPSIDLNIYNSSITINSTLIDNLNSRVTTDNNWSKWLLNINNKTITFKIHDSKNVSFSSQIILVPDIIDDWYGSIWFTDDTHTSLFTGYLVSDDTTLYWGWNKYNITFNAKGGNTNIFSKYVSYGNSYSELPIPNRTGYTFTGWFNEENMSITNEIVVNVTSDHTLYAHWIPNNYTITLDVSGGNGLDSNTKNATFDSIYGELPSPNRDGFTFIGWFTNDTLEIINESVVNVASDHTLYAHWISNNYTITLDVNGGVELDSNTKNVTFESIYGELPIPNRDGFTFIGWFNDNNEFVTSSTTVNISSNHALHAHWNANNYTVSLNVNGGVELNENEKIKTVPADSAYYYLPKPNRAGYTFSGWFTEGNILISNDTTTTGIVTNNQTLHAHWNPNNYTITFNVNGGDELDNNKTTVTFDSNYNSLPKPTKNGYKFIGWFTNNNLEITSSTIVNIPSNHTLYAHWKQNSNSTLVVAIVVPVCIVIVAIAVVAILFVLLKNNNSDNKRKNNIELGDTPGKNYSRFISSAKDESNLPTGKTESILSNLYPPNYERPTMKNALKKANLTEQQAASVCEACNIASRYANKDSLPEGFTTDDAAAIAMYTYDFGGDNYDINPYRLINKNLINNDYDGLQRAEGILYLVMSALRKLPRFKGENLYRGLRGEVDLSAGHYCKGNIITWPGLSSTSPDMKVTKAFLASGTEDGKAAGTMFVIEGGWGYDIQPYSLFPDEREILLEPERQFRVNSVIHSNLTVVNLQMLDTPLSVPEVFGEGIK